jgi:hypothetical protein
MMDDRLERTLADILAAFDERRLHGDEPWFTSRSPEVDVDALTALIRGTEWPNLPWRTLCSNSVALAFATPAAFRYLLPACMSASLAHYVECGTLTSMLLSCLTPEDDRDAETFAELERYMESLEDGFVAETGSHDALSKTDETQAHFEGRKGLLTAAERDAVTSYLRYLDDVHGGDFPVFGPQEALARLWGGADGGGGQ